MAVLRGSPRSHLDCALTQSQRSGRAIETSEAGLIDYSLFLTGLLRPLSIHARGRVIVGEEPDEVRGFVQGLQALLDLREQAVRNVLGEHHLAGGGRRFRRRSHEGRFNGENLRN